MEILDVQAIEIHVVQSSSFKYMVIPSFSKTAVIAWESDVLIKIFITLLNLSKK